jgi:hypothetical protein
LGDKSAFLGVALNFANRYNPEILAYLDGNHDGVLDLLEAQLAKIAPHAPVTPTVIPTPAAPPPMQGFVGSPIGGLTGGPTPPSGIGRATDPQGFLQTPSTPMPHRRQTPAEMAAKLAPKRTKSTVMQ